MTKLCLRLLLCLGLPLRAARAQDIPTPSVPARTAEASSPQISVRVVVQMALKAARHTAPGRADELGKRARLAGLVPQLKLGARRGLQQDQSSSSTLSDDRTNASLGDDLTLEAGLTFQLDRLVFAPEQVRLLAVERWLASDRRKLIEDVVHLYFRRARFVHERDAAAQADAAIDADIAELDALLDAYTDGEFSAALAKLPPPSSGEAAARRQTNAPADSAPTRTAPDKPNASLSVSGPPSAGHESR